jgi:hypothetical protein
MGVHKPTRRSIPAAVSSNGRMTTGHWAPPNSSATPSSIRKMPETNRTSRRPLPGQPFGNIEKSRCTETSTTSIGVSRYWSNLQKMASSHPPFEGDHSSMIPRFSPIVTACVRSFAPNLERMLLTWPLTVSSVIESLSATILFAFPAAISLSTSISREVNESSARWSATCRATSAGTRFWPAWTARIVSRSSLR